MREPPIATVVFTFAAPGHAARARVVATAGSLVDVVELGGLGWEG